MSVVNLDAACAELGHKLGTHGRKPKDTENSITKTLGVLEEQGVYAMFLYLHAREKALGREFSKKLMEFLKLKVQEPWSNETGDQPFDALQKLSENLDNLLFARDLLHQSLVYARYHAKAAGASDNGSKSTGKDKKSGRNEHAQPKASK